ncbi:hypothetical protein [Cellulomonas sp. P24]|uniref:hypothetical protein n=1 Tax=Cellulomonas sp. P24 TaxID=2885206 RepID=UPI00216AC8C9|nr:hypothetical protein [Cellulomonas sp. P24]MCR6493525.1 hypothetical protein [Cellulomonas sp. P24]
MRMDFSTFVPDLLVNLLSAAAIFTLSALFWPSRHAILAWLRSLVSIHGVQLYLSMNGDRWNIEVPNASINDVKWRLRRYTLSSADHVTSGTADEYSEAFELFGAGFDRGYEAEANDIAAELKKLRIFIRVIGTVGGEYPVSGEEPSL